MRLQENQTFKNVISFLIFGRNVLCAKLTYQKKFPTKKWTLKIEVLHIFWPRASPRGPKSYYVLRESFADAYWKDLLAELVVRIHMQYGLFYHILTSSQFLLWVNAAQSRPMMYSQWLILSAKTSTDIPSSYFKFYSWIFCFNLIFQKHPHLNNFIWFYQTIWRKINSHYWTKLIFKKLV